MSVCPKGRGCLAQIAATGFQVHDVETAIVEAYVGKTVAPKPLRPTRPEMNMIRAGLIALTAFLFSLAAGAAECTPTLHRTIGTHYKPVTEQQGDVGSGLVVRGRILAAPDCKPVANAKVAHWQAGEQGEYLDRLRAYLFADENGRYEFETEWPNLDVPHIHFIITAPGYDTLETQWVGSRRTDLIEFDMVLRER
ncbi:MAG: hypothetical protein WA970_25315 [Gammaproteobacteria bacterium]